MHPHRKWLWVGEREKLHKVRRGMQRVLVEREIGLIIEEYGRCLLEWD